MIIIFDYPLLHWIVLSFGYYNTLNELKTIECYDNGWVISSQEHLQQLVDRWGEKTVPSNKRLLAGNYKPQKM